MKRFKELARRVAYFGRRNQFEQDLDSEMHFHLECRADEFEREGVSRKEALARARREFGSSSRLSEDARSAWQIRWVEDLFSDLRYAARAFRRNPGFALTAITSLALGIGVNTTIFSLTMELLFSRPSARDPETLAAIRIGGNSHAPMREYRFVRDAKLFDGLAGFREQGETNWRTGESSLKVFAARVTDNFFDVLGVPVAMGRGIRPGDEYTVIISDRFWRNRLASDPDVLKRSLILDGRAHAVLGVLPRDHRTILGFGLAPELYLPASEKTNVALYGRLSEGMSRPGAQAALKGICERLDQTHPSAYMKWAQNITVAAVAGIERISGKELRTIAAFFALLMIVVAMVLLIACANVASLLLARAASRTHELAVRLSIGAGPLRIVRQLLAESLLLSLLGTCAGLVLNVWLTGLISRVPLPLPIPIRLLIEPDWRLLSYSAVIAIVSSLLCGLMPALNATRTDANAALKRQERQVTGGRWILRGFLVAGQLAVSIVLLATAFLFLRNLGRSTTMSPGFDVDRTVWVAIRLVPERYPEPDKVRTRAETVLEAVRAVPGIESASLALIVPFNDNYTRGGEFRVSGSTETYRIPYYYARVGPNYFRTMGIPMLGGREFLATDRAGAPGAVIMNETFARRVFGASSPVGRTIRFGDGQPQTIVGLAKDSKYATLGEDPRPALYEAYFQQKSESVILNVLARAASPESVVRSLEATCLRLDSSAAVDVKPMRNAMGLALLPSQAGALLLGSTGLLAIILASIGLYGMLTYAVAGRIREIGLRVALGAEPGAILRLVLGQSLALVGAGATIGIGIAIFAMKPLAMFLVPGLSPTDPVVFVAVVTVLAAVALLATIAPARRALRVDPMTALRYE